MRIPCFTIKSLLLVSVLLPLGSAGAVDFFSQRQRTRAKCVLPNHDYDHDAWPYTTPRSFRATALAVAATDPTNTGERLKPFHFRATALTVDHITLDQVGLALYRSDGRLVATGRVMCGGADGGLIGNNVTIRLRAYVAHTTAAAASITKTVVSPAQSTQTAGVEEAAVAVEETKEIVDQANDDLAAAVAALENTPATGKLTLEGVRARLAGMRTALRRVKVEPSDGDAGPAAVVKEIQVATPNQVNRLPPDAYKVWESEHKLWVSRGLPQHIQLAPKAGEFANRVILTRHFDDITHFEVELEYGRDR